MYKSPHCDKVSSIEGVTVTYRVTGRGKKEGVHQRMIIVSEMPKDNGKVLDFAVLTKNCKACKYWEKKKETPEYEQFLSVDDCPINHEKSSGSIESAGAVTIFNGSTVCNKLRYKTYIDDGDTQSYHEVVKSDPYPGLSIKKGECVGHVQKRLGTCLRKPAYKIKGTKLSDGKPLTGKGD